MWVILNSTTIPISSIEIIVMEGKYYFIVQCTNQKVYLVYFDAMSAEKGQIVKSVILQTPNAIFARFIIYFYRNK